MTVAIARLRDSNHTDLPSLTSTKHSGVGGVPPTFSRNTLDSSARAWWGVPPTSSRTHLGHNHRPSKNTNPPKKKDNPYSCFAVHFLAFFLPLLSLKP